MNGVPHEDPDQDRGQHRPTRADGPRDRPSEDGEPSRLFVAVWPPAQVLEQVAALARPGAPGVRWTTRSQWHVTLRFLGRAVPSAAAEALDTLSSLPGASATTAEVGPVVSRLGHSVVCLPVTGLDHVAAAVAEATAAVGDPVDPRPFAGHLTLARLRNQAACGVVGTAFRASFDVEEVALVASELHPDGARYTTVATWPLSPSH